MKVTFTGSVPIRAGLRSAGSPASRRVASAPIRRSASACSCPAAVGGSAAAVLVIAGSASVVTTAADKEDTREKAPADGIEKPTVVPSPKVEDSGKKDPEIVYVPVSGGAGAGGAVPAPESAPKSDPAGTTGGTSGTTGGQEEQSSSSKERSTQSGTTTGYLWSDGSVDADTNDYWDQSTVTVKSTKPLTSLKVVVRIIQTGGVSSTGAWSSLGDKVTVGQNAASGQVGHVITLKPAVTLDPGTYVLKVQYNHDQGNRDAARDLYSVTAVATDSDDEFREGRF